MKHFARASGAVAFDTGVSVGRSGSGGGIRTGSGAAGGGVAEGTTGVGATGAVSAGTTSGDSGAGEAGSLGSGGAASGSSSFSRRNRRKSAIGLLESDSPIITVGGRAANVFRWRGSRRS
jgi:hypothetical protein